MKVAAPIWARRVSPVFDVARRLLLVEIDQGRVCSRMEHALPREDRPAAVARLGVEVLICGAVSLGLQRRLRSLGIEVLSETCGPIDEVIQAYLEGTLGDSRFAMPGSQRTRSLQDALHHGHGPGARLLHGAHAPK